MSTTLWLAAALAAVPVITVVTARFRDAGPPRLNAGVELLNLVSLALLPPVVLVCAADNLCNPASCRATLCLGEAGTRDAGTAVQLGLYALAALLVARIGVLSVRAVAAAGRAELRGRALASATCHATVLGEPVWVLPSSQLAAYSGGWWRPTAIVTTGLLRLLGPDEQEAVMCHEAAHLRAGHPRLLVVATALAQAYSFLPQAQSGLRRLRRFFEAAADDEVVAATGAQPLLRALAKVALSLHVRPAGLGFGEPSDLGYRVARLQRPGAVDRAALCGLLATCALVVALLAWSACTAAHASAPGPGLLTCLVSFAWFGLRPARRGSRPTTSASEPLDAGLVFRD
jgi:hypothetical protein